MSAVWRKFMFSAKEQPGWLLGTTMVIQASQGCEACMRLCGCVEKA